MSLRSKNIFTHNITSLTAHDLSVEWKENVLNIQYEIKSWKAIYDISDINGRILLKGDLCCGLNSIPLPQLKPATYTLWIVDGADLLKYNFTVK